MTSFFRSLTLIVTLVPSAAALAQSAPPPAQGEPSEFQKVREACHEDIARLCQEVKPGGGRIRECLRAHQDQVSEGCKVAMREARAHHHPHPDQN
jgi:hypothetical protein